MPKDISNGNAKSAVGDGFAQLRLIDKKLYAQGKDMVVVWDDASGAWQDSDFGSNQIKGINNKGLVLENDFVLLYNIRK